MLTLAENPKRVNREIIHNYSFSETVYEISPSGSPRITLDIPPTLKVVHCDDRNTP